MTWKSIVAGVDSSAEGLHAARTAVRLARAAKTKCHLVHAVRDPWTGVYLKEVPLDLTDHNRMVLESARAALVEALKGDVPQSVLGSLEVRYGRTGAVLAESADRHDAELIVLGGKHHSVVGRWVAGSTAHYLVRAHDRPLLVVGPERATDGEEHFRRVLVAVDLSAASHSAIQGAERFARLFRTRLAALHVVEPFPIPPAIPLGMDVDVTQRSQAELERSVWPQFQLKDVERMVRRGPAADTIADVAIEWKADLVVVGSHGYAWVDRVLIGSVTEQLLNRLPTSVLVMPVPAPGKSQPRVKPVRSGKGRQPTRRRRR